MPLAVLCIVLSMDARAATITSAATGNWSAGGTWVGGVAPAATDNAVIAAGHTVTLTANTTITGLTVNAVGVLSTANRTLGVSGNLVVNGTLSGTGAITLSGAGTNIDGTGSITNTAQLTISAAHTVLSTAALSFSGTIRVQGAITVTNNGTVTTATAGGITGTAAGSTWTQGTTGVLNIAGPLLTTGTLTASANGNTVNYNGAAQTVKATATYHHLTLSGSGIKTLTATTTAINGNLTMSGTATTATVVGLTIGGTLNVGTGTTFTAAAFALTVGGTTNVTGILTISSATGAKAFNGDVAVNVGGTWNNTAANAALTLPGSISNSGTFNAGTGVHTFSGSGKTISGTLSIPNVTVSGTYQNNGTLGVTTALAGAGTLTNGATGTLNINFTGAVGLTNLTATAVGNTVNYGFAGTQTIKATTYHHLILLNTSAKTAGGALTVNGDFTISGTATFAGGTSLTHTFLGNWIVNTTAATPFSFTTTSTLNFNPPATPAATSFSGSSAATLGFNTVNLNNTSGFSSSENFSISGTLTVAANVTFTPSAAVVVSGTGTLTGSGTVKVTRTAATPDFNSQYSISTKTLTNLTVDYDATAAQTVNALNYFNLTISANRGGTTVTLAAGTVGISGTFAPNATNVSYTVTGNTVDYNGTIAQTVVAFNYNNLTSSSSGTRTLANSGTIGIAGTFTPGANSYTITGSTIDFNGAGPQTIPAFNYNNLTSSSSGARTLASSGTIGIAGIFTPGTNSFTITGSTIDFNDAGAQTIPVFNYNNLTSSSSGARTLASSGTIGIAGTFTPGANSYTITGSTIDFNGAGAQTIPAFNYNNLTSSSSGARTLANSGTIGIAGAFTPGINTFTITGSTIDFNGSGAQTVPAFNYNNLTSSSSGARTLASSGTIGIAGAFAPGTNTFTITGSTIDFNGAGPQTIPAFNYNNLTSSSSGARTLASSGTIGIAGIFTPGTNTFTITGSSIDFNGSGAQTIPAFNYDNLTSSSSGARTLASSGTVGIAGAFTPGTNSFTITSSTVDFNGAGVQTIPAFNYNNLTSSSSGARTLAGSGTVGIAGAFTPGTNSYTITSSTIDFNGAGAQTIPAFNYNNLTISGSRTVNNVTLGNSGTIGVAGALIETATFNAGNGLVTTGSTVDYNGTGSQTVTALSPLVAGNTYNNLTISNTASAVTASTSFSVGGNFTINANATFAPASAVVISGGGTLMGSGTAQVTMATGSTDFTSQYTITNKTLTNLTVEFAGASAQGNGSDAFGGLRINNPSGLTLSGDATVNGTLTLVGGNITTSSNKVIISSTGIVSRTSGHVVGNLQKNVATGPTSLTFEVGDASNYTPVDVSFAGVTSAGDLIAVTTSGDLPNIGTSNIIPSKSVNRYWTLTNSGIVFTTYSATFNFAAGDLDGGVDTAALIVGKYASGAWSYPAVGTRTATSTQATGLSSFSDFQLGEGGTPNIVLVKDVTPSGSQEPDTDLAYTVTFTNSGSIAAQSLVITDPNPNDIDPTQRIFANVDYKLGSASISSPWSATTEFSNDGGSSWSYTPVSGGGGAPSGYDRVVTNIRGSVTGNVAASATGTISYTVRIR
jgi:hypothetical protein